MSENSEFIRISETQTPQQRGVALLFQQLLAQGGIWGVAQTIIHNNKKYCIQVEPQQLKLTVEGVCIMVLPDGLTYETRDYGISYRVEDVNLKSLINVLHAFLQSSRIAELVGSFIKMIERVSGTTKKTN